MGQLDRGLKWAGDWEGARAYGGRGMAGYKNLGGYKNLEGDRGLDIRHVIGLGFPAHTFSKMFTTSLHPN